MRRKVAAGDLAFTDGWGAYLIVQVVTHTVSWLEMMMRGHAIFLLVP